MPPIPGVMQWHSLAARHVKNLKAAFEKVSKAIDNSLSGGKLQAQVEPILVRNTPRQPLHPLARIRQSQSRGYSTARSTVNNAARQFSTSTTTRSAPKFNRASFPTSRVSSYIAQSSGRAPFASTLRPNLTGGTLGRTAGGYTWGSGRAGGARYFSHGPAAQAQVVQNVSQAVRAFFISGHKAQFDGLSPRSGQKQYKAISTLQEQTGRKMRDLPKATPGSWIEFQINPTITALTTLMDSPDYKSNSQPIDHLNTEGLINALSVDFSRALKDQAAVLNNINRLSALGDLPITYQGTQIRVHFPGCDADTVERLCQELEVTRGLIVQDEAFDSFAGTEVALLFPFAPSEDGSDCESLFEREPAQHYKQSGHLISLEDMLTPSESAPRYPTPSDSGLEDVISENPWLSSPSGFESVRSNSEFGSHKHTPSEYQGIEGIYRFIEQCDSARR